MRSPFAPLPLVLFLACSGGGPETATPTGTGGGGSSASTFFTTGQEADFMLSGLGFNQAGGGLLFNHPRSLATDGTRMALSDGQNNRILLWNTPPTANQPPDLVLGQTDFDGNEPGTGLDRFSWPGQVSFDSEGRLIVADTYNDRLLVWNAFPTRTGQSADYALTHAQLKWPWGVWSGSGKLVASATGARAVLVWNTLPGASNPPPSFTLSQGGIGTPRTITSDGHTLMIGDHNAIDDQQTDGGQSGTWVWKTFPGSAANLPDFFLQDPVDSEFGWLSGSFGPDGKLFALGRNLYVWDGPPQSSSDLPSLSLTSYRFEGGDGGAAVLAGGRLYVQEYNGNKLSAFQTPPTSSSAQPDFPIGSPDLQTNTLDSHAFITNGVPATDGSVLLVSSDFDRRLYGWKGLPSVSGTHPDWTLDLGFQPWDNALAAGKFILAGGRQVSVWNSIPDAARAADKEFKGTVGSVAVNDLSGVAYDGTNFFLADRTAGKVYVWSGIPSGTEAPRAVLLVAGATRLDSDGTVLVVTVPTAQSIHLFRIPELGTGQPARTLGGVGTYNLPQGACLPEGRLMVANTQFNQVWIWHKVETALAGANPDAILGSQDRLPRIGKADLFWPGALAAAGSALWVGEHKFGNRLLHYRAK